MRQGAAAVVVTGVPGAGKTSLGSDLASGLRAKLISLDEIKESIHADRAALDDFPVRLAAEAVLERAIAAAAGVVVDIWIEPIRDTDRVIALLNRSAGKVVEVLCRVPADTAVGRYASRHRAGPHKPADEETLLRIERAVELIGPLGMGACIEVDTSAPVDIAVLADRVARELNQSVAR